VTPAPSVLVSSYVNATRAALEALEILGGGPAVHVRSGPGALRGCEPPASVRSMSLASVIALDTRGARRDVATACSVVAERLARLPSDDPWAGWQDHDSTSFRRALLTVLLPEVAASVGSIQLLAAAVRAERFVVGDEFSFVDRAALHAARARGLATVSRQHGILDSHYRREGVLSDLHLAWDPATISWLADHGALRADGVARAAPRKAACDVARAGTGRDIVVFLQPLEMIGVPTGDWMREALLPLARVAAAEGVALVAKLHPLQVRAALEEFVPREARKGLRLVAAPSARELLASCGVAVTLDSSVAVDCRDAGIPCLSTAWYAGTYAEDLARLGWVVPCASPTELERAARAALAPRPGDPEGGRS
jgi:hypothetical protein